MINFLYTEPNYFDYALMLTKNKMDAEDIIQDVAISLFRNNYSESIARKAAWKAIRNRFKDFKRRKQFDELLDYSIPIPSFENSFIAKDQLKNLYIKILMLPKKDKECLLLAAEGIPYKKIAKVLNLSPVTVAPKICLSRNFLKTA